MKREHFIDIMKGIGILLVILGHTSIYLNKYITIYIYSFHIPLFFFVSGYLYNEKYEKIKTVDFFKKVLKQLMYPYFTLSIINFVYFILKDGIKNVYKYLLSLLYSNYIFDVNYVGAIWFLGCLFIIEFLFYCLKKYFKKNGSCTFFMGTKLTSTHIK